MRRARKYMICVAIIPRKSNVALDMSRKPDTRIYTSAMLLTARHRRVPWRKKENCKLALSLPSIFTFHFSLPQVQPAKPSIWPSVNRPSTFSLPLRLLFFPYIDIKVTMKGSHLRKQLFVVSLYVKASLWVEKILTKHHRMLPISSYLFPLWHVLYLCVCKHGSKAVNTRWILAIRIQDCSTSLLSLPACLLYVQTIHEQK